MRWLVAALLVGCRGDAPTTPPAPVPKDAAVQLDARIAPDGAVSERIPGVWLSGLSDDGSQAIVESIPGTKGPRQRIAIDIATLQVVERGPLADEIFGTTLRRSGSALHDGGRLVEGTAGFTGVWRRAGDALLIVLHQTGLPSCFARIAGTPAMLAWRYCVDPGEALDIVLSPHGAWGAWTTRDPLEDFMRVHTFSIAKDAVGPVTQDLGIPVISDGGRVVVRGASDNCEFRGETELVCWRDERLVVERLP